MGQRLLGAVQGADVGTEDVVASVAVEAEAEPAVGAEDPGVDAGGIFARAAGEDDVQVGVVAERLEGRREAGPLQGVHDVELERIAAVAERADQAAVHRGAGELADAERVRVAEHIVDHLVVAGPGVELDRFDVGEMADLGVPVEDNDAVAVVVDLDLVGLLRALDREHAVRGLGGHAHKLAILQALDVGANAVAVVVGRRTHN